MENFEFHLPTRYIFGQGSVKRTAEVVKEYGYKKVMIVYGSNYAKRSGLLDEITAQFKNLNLEYTLLGGVKPNPRADLVYAGIKQGIDEGIDFLLAVGGGSVIDTAKAIAIGIKDQEHDFFDFYLRVRKPLDALKVGCVLTIPAAGSESSISSVIEKVVDGKNMKCGLGTPLFRPLFAIMDPTLTYTLPAYETACGITDMMAHIMERYFTNSKGVDVTDEMCEGLLRAIIENAATVLRDPSDYNARANIMWAGALAHNNLLGVDREQDWATHHLEHQLSALYDVAHGAGLAVMFPAWMEYVYSHDVMRFAKFAHRIFNIPLDFEDPSHTAQQGISALRAFFASIHMPLSFADIDAHEDDIPKMLSMLGVDDKEHAEGKFMVLYRSDCEKIYMNAVNYGKKIKTGAVRCLTL